MIKLTCVVCYRKLVTIKRVGTKIHAECRCSEQIINIDYLHLKQNCWKTDEQLERHGNYYDRMREGKGV